MEQCFIIIKFLFGSIHMIKVAFKHFFINLFRDAHHCRLSVILLFQKIRPKICSFYLQSNKEETFQMLAISIVFN